MNKSQCKAPFLIVYIPNQLPKLCHIGIFRSGNPYP